MSERDFKGVWIPKDIYLDTNLNWTEKILLIEIDSLDGPEGCFANNEHFAKHLSISKDRVSKLISKLVNLKYITLKLIYKPNSQQIEKRILHSTIGYRRKQLEGIGENNFTPIGENNEDNNTIINNTNYILLSLYEELGFGTINSISKSDIEVMSKEYSAKWVEEAMKEANESGVRNLKYVKGILKNWKTKGFKSEKVVKGNGSTSKSTKNTESEKPKYNFDSLYGK